MKRLIFDIDNTLIKWKNEYTIVLENLVNKYNIDIDFRVIDAIIEEQDKLFETISYEQLLDQINSKCSLNLTIDFVKELMIDQEKIAEVDQEVIDTLEYLKDKYEMVILTNYYIEPQIGRLKTAKIDKYFTEFYGGDNAYLKPYAKAYEIAAGNNKMNNCIMIGDTLSTDIQGALAVGMEAIQIDYFNKVETSPVTLIHEIKKLKEIL